MQVDARIGLLDGAQQVLVIVDAQIGVQPALHQNARAAERDGLFDFFENGLEGQDVSVLRAQRPIERAERAILGAEIRVIDIAIDLVGDHARIGLFLAQLVRSHADADQVIGAEQIERFLL